MRKYNYSKIDAFVDENSLGNPAACFYLNENEILSDNDMLQIAKEQAKYVSEVVFCTITEKNFYLTYFSSQCEVNFCGHGTIACMHNYIKNNKKLINQKEIKIQTRKKGELTIYNEILENDVVYIEAPAPIYYQNSLSKEEVVNVLGASMDDISNDYPMEIIDAGNKTLIVPIVN